MENITLSLEAMAGLIGIQPGELSAAVKNDKDELKPQADIDKYIKEMYSSKLNVVRSEARNEGHGRGKRETLTTLEKEIAQKYGVDPADTDTMIKTIIKKSGEGKEVTPEMIKSSETYVNDLKSEIDKRLAIEQDFEQFKTGVTLKEQKSAVRGAALKALQDSKEFKLPKTEKVLSRLLDALTEEIMTDRKIDIKDGEISLLDKNGNPIRNNLQNVMTLSDVTLSVGADYFEPMTGDGRSSPGAETQKGGQQTAHNFEPVKDQEDFINRYRALDTMEKKQAFKAFYDQQKAASN